MQISNNNSPAFGSIHVNTSRMNQVQRDISERVARYLEYASEYITAHKNGYDVYFLPSKRQREVSVKYIDRNSDCFIRVNNGSQITYGDKIAKVLDKINKGLCKFAEFDAKKIVNMETDVAKLRPRSYAALEQGIDDLSTVMYKENMIDYLADEHVMNSMMFPKDSNF